MTMLLLFKTVHTCYHIKSVLLYRTGNFRVTPIKDKTASSTVPPCMGTKQECITCTKVVTIETPIKQKYNVQQYSTVIVQSWYTTRQFEREGRVALKIKSPEAAAPLVCDHPIATLAFAEQFSCSLISTNMHF